MVSPASIHSMARFWGLIIYHNNALSLFLLRLNPRELNDSTNRLQEHLVTTDTQNTTLSESEPARGMSQERFMEDNDGNEDVVYDSSDATSTDDNVGNFDRHSIIRQSIRSDSSRYIRQNNLRVSVRSEQGIIHRIQHPADQEDTNDHHQRKAKARSGSTHSLGVARDKTKTVEQGGHQQAWRSHENVINERRVEFVNLTPGMKHLSIRETQTSDQQDDEILITSPHGAPQSFAISPALGDIIPGFKDPEILGDDGQDLEKLHIQLPPDIYSSQILSTVQAPGNSHDNEMHCDLYDDSPEPALVITELRQSSQSLDRIISLEPSGWSPSPLELATLLSS